MLAVLYVVSEICHIIFILIMILERTERSQQSPTGSSTDPGGRRFAALEARMPLTRDTRGMDDLITFTRQVG